ncbi:cysteine-rich receptor-like protein kinase 10 isoform X1 [Vigna angularis]|nr:cysteine-rich receptor-like protein kinase 10 isoform X1 [Vigna angularis]
MFTHVSMASLKLVLLLFILSFLNLNTCKAQNQLSDDPVYLYHNCSGGNTTANSAYQLNVGTLFSSLSSKSIEFSNDTVGTSSSDRVYGLFMCRGDVPTALCQQCVLNATRRLRSECSLAKQAVIWYDECTVRYSNRSFFSTVAVRPRVGLLNTANISNQEAFMKLLFSTINTTADEAANFSVGLKKYATKQANISGFQSLYCLAQCTPDLSPQDCRSCLSDVIGDLPWCCQGKQGGRVLYPSCNVRYELYPFYRQVAPAPPPSSPLLPPPASANSQGGGGISTGTIVAIVVPITVAVLLFIVGICFLSRRARKKQGSLKEGKNVDDITTVESLQFSFGTISAATNNFSAENKLGEGGFGEVFKGALPTGQEIAVKRLSKSSGQGGEEFKNEVVVVAKLQHRNLVRLLGFCLQGEEKILVYEYVPNKSLDYTLFDPEKQRELDWRRRYKIIEGTARGIQYLHEDSRLRIIHRDLKASNILLDSDLSPKISDFGMARIFGVDQTQGNTDRIVGTYGYMAPEYAMHGEFSVKSDVYSFGVLLMEIISGKKNSSFYQTDGAEDLLSYAWLLWKDGTPLELMDPILRESYNQNEIIRTIHIGLLCVQEDPEDRPTMATIVLMLDSSTVTLPTPKRPAFFIHSGTDTYMPKGQQFDQSITKSLPVSINEVSISEMDPR